MSDASTNEGATMLVFATLRVLFVVALAILCIVADGSEAEASYSAHVSANAQVCHEDMPCWDWAIMGNRQRGIVTVYGTPMVVSACRFAKLRRLGLVDYPRHARMRGDRTALRICPSRPSHTPAS